MDAFGERRDGRGRGGDERREGEGLGWKGNEKERMYVCGRGGWMSEGSRLEFVLGRTGFCSLCATCVCLSVFASLSLSPLVSPSSSFSSLSLSAFPSLSLSLSLSLAVSSAVPPCILSVDVVFFVS